MLTQKYINGISYSIVGCSIEVDIKNITQSLMLLVSKDFAKLPKE